MKLLRKTLCVTLAVSVTWMPVRQASAEDIDLFVSSGTPAAVNPNVIIMIDNSANWSRNDQNWPNNEKQGQSELRALKSVIGEVTDQINIGLMMFTTGAGSDPSGSYVRYHVRQMTAANKTGFQDMIGADSGCVASNPAPSLTPSCILANFDRNEEKVASAKTDYSAALFDAFKYLGGYTQPSLARLNQAGSPVDASHFGITRYAGSPADSPAGALDVKNRMDRAAYNEDARSTYNSPINSTLSCAKNYLVFIGNGFPSQDAASTLLSGINGSTTQLSMPQFNTGTSFQEEVVGTDAVCESVSACVARAQTVALAPNYSLWNCSGGAPGVGSPATLGTDAACKTASQCATDAATSFPGFLTYSCTGGTAGPPSTVTFGIDAACKTQATCATNAATTNPGFAPYSCTGGSTTTASTVTLGTYAPCATTSACETAAAALYPGKDTYSCSGGSGTGCSGSSKKDRLIEGTLNACSGTNLRNQTKQGTAVGCTAPALVGQTIQGTNSCLVNQKMNASRSLITVTPTGISAAPTTARFTDEWAKYLNTTDVNSATGQQAVQVFAIDVFKDHQDVDQTALLLSMAKYGGGKYFQASNENAIIDALRQIMIEIQSVNTVFAAASLPINATNRSQNENQVFIGMFRPDGGAKPRWYGNLKRYQIALFGTEAKLADASTPPLEAVSATTGFVQPCAKSFWTSDSGTYWNFPNGSAGTCTTSGTNEFSDSPDGAQVEKGGAAEVVRKGNLPPTTDTTPTNVVGRTLKTCTGACASLVDFDNTNVTQAMVGAADATEHLRIINYTRGVDVADDNASGLNTDTRPSIHGDVAHSRPLPVNYGGTTGVMLYYGVNDGVFRAVRGDNGKEVWGFIAPEHFTRLKRLSDNLQTIDFGQTPAPSPAPARKDYFFDGTAGLYQNADNSKVWIFPAMRRGGRMIYAFDVTTPATPSLKWRLGCTDPSLTDTASCTTGFEQMGQTWSTPLVAAVKGYTGGQDAPLVLIGGGYDTCEDNDDIATTCSSPKGNRVYVINANTGARVKTFNTDRSVAADVTLVDRDFDQRVDHAYVADMGGGLYRIDFVDPANPTTTRAETDWTITKIAQTSSTSGGGGRKFLFGPSALPSSGTVFLSIVSGDRERPLITNYPYVDDLSNRVYMLVDSFLTSGLPINLDDTAQLPDRTSDNSCSTLNADGSAGNRGWSITIGGSSVGSQGEQGVTASLIFGGLIFFSTNRPLPVSAGSCDNNLGEAKGYALNLLNGSGAIGVGGLCGGTRSDVFTGGGLPPSPVTGTVPVDGKPVTVMIGGINREGGTSSPIGAQRVKPNIAQKRSRVYWYRQGDK